MIRRALLALSLLYSSGAAWSPRVLCAGGRVARHRLAERSRPGNARPVLVLIKSTSIEVLGD
jgi:hypothetical protein